MLPETDIHVFLDIFCMCRNIVYDTLLDCPPEKIQLTHSRLLNRGMPADLEANALTTTKGIEEALRICLQLPLVMEMYHKLTILVTIADIELLGVIRDEPVNETQTYRRLTC